MIDKLDSVGPGVGSDLATDAGDRISRLKRSKRPEYRKIRKCFANPHQTSTYGFYWMEETFDITYNFIKKKILTKVQVFGFMTV